MKVQRSSRTRPMVLGALAVVSSLTLAACGSDDNEPESGSKDTNAKASNIDCGGGKGQLLGNGSSAQKNAIDQWVKDFQAACDTTINYKAEGSGAGIQNFLQGKVAFAGSDAALKPEEVTESKKVCKDGQGINLPMVAGPVALIHNVQGVDNLVLDAKTIAQIFDSKIKKWDDPAIKKLNPDAKLPSTAIQAFHRSDESGTTKNFSEYLTKAAPDNWKYEADKKWLADGGQSANGSAGVSSQVKQVSGAISYAEISYADANQLKTVKLDTGAAEPVEATVANASTAIGEAKVVGTGKDLALDVAFDTKAEGAYPISLVTYEIVCDKGNKPETLESVKAFLAYTASEDGQKSISDKGYAPIPDEIIAKVREVIPTLA